MIFFTADLHFCHERILELVDRPFRSLPEMHSVLISNWNTVVTNNDDIYILGDFMHHGSGADANKILNRLNGNKYLIKGNHDKFLKDDSFDMKNFKWVKDYYKLKYDNMKFILFHFPILEWDGYFSNSIHLFGHVHNHRKSQSQESRMSVLGSRAFNVGVDVNNFYPVSIKDIIKKVDR